MKYNKFSKIILNKNYFRKFIINFIIICILCYIIYLYYNKINENYGTYISPTSLKYDSLEYGIWTVPKDVYSVTFTVVGGKGGNYYAYDNIRGYGGNGAKVVTKLSVTPGTKYYIFVGSNGSNGFYNSYYKDVNYSNAGTSSDRFNLDNGLSRGNYSGGIGNYWNSYGFNFSTPGGGAASLISTTPSPTLTPIIIAGGGGGGSLDSDGGNGGANILNGNGGNGGSRSGGLGGNGTVNRSNLSTNNSGTTAVLYDGGSGGGGGGGGANPGLAGYYGAPGGAGGSFVDSLISTMVSFSTDTTGSPYININWTLPTITQTPTSYVPTTNSYLSTYKTTSPVIYNSFTADDWTVPPDVYSVTFTVVGGKGGNSYDINGGYGAQVVTKLSVTPGTVYYIYVGSNGNDYNTTTNTFGGMSSDDMRLFSGGTSVGNGGGGDGGAASLISASKIYLIPIIIAGGGGGGGTGYSANGGNGCAYRNNNGGNGGDYSTSFKGGVGGYGTTNFQRLSYFDEGARGQSSKDIPDSDGSGSGGGGAFPGRAGNKKSGGGAGGSFVDSRISNDVLYSTDTTGTPYIKIEWNYKPTTTAYVPTTTAYVPTSTEYVPTTTPYVPTTTPYVPISTSYVPTTEIEIHNNKHNMNKIMSHNGLVLSDLNVNPFY